MRLLIVDNHDSFVFNIVGLLRQCAAGGRWRRLTWTVVKNDEIDFSGLTEYDGVILSPGPGLPNEANGLMRVVSCCAHAMPVLGICLGCQAIALHFGAALRQLEKPCHGHLSYLTEIDAADPLVGCFENGKVGVGRYHSWVVDNDSLPPELIAGSRDEDGNIMSLRHKSLPVFGTQFHPESIISEAGAVMLGEYLDIVAARCGLTGL